MILKPIQLNPPNTDASKEVLVSAGIIKATKKGSTPQDTFKNSLDSHGASLDEVASNLAYLMGQAENESVRISAAKMIATAHGALTEIGDAPPPIINITIEGNSGQQVINILMPHQIRNTKEEVHV